MTTQISRRGYPGFFSAIFVCSMLVPMNGFAACEGGTAEIPEPIFVEQEPSDVEELASVVFPKLQSAVLGRCEGVNADEQRFLEEIAAIRCKAQGADCELESTENPQATLDPVDCKGWTAEGVEVTPNDPKLEKVLVTAATCDTYCNRSIDFDCKSVERSTQDATFE